MELMCSTELTAGDRHRLLDVAERALREGVKNGCAPAVTVNSFPDSMQIHRASFVTLMRNGELRGCIGSLEPHRPLVVDVSENAYAAGFRDPRFPPLTQSELEGLTIQVSVLTLPEKMYFSSEDDLLKQLNPDIDGLILKEDARRSTFLPSVWKSLTEPKAFLAHLKLKAGLPPDYWSDTLEVERYRTETFAGSPLPDRSVSEAR